MLSSIITSWIPGSENTIAIASNLHKSPVFIFGCSLVWVSSFIRTTSYRELGKQFTYNVGIVKDPKLVTTGIYSVVRHPAYTGILVASVGWVLSCFSRGSSWDTYSYGAPEHLKRWAFVSWVMMYVVYTVYIVARAPLEERMLSKAFPEQWEMYTKRTPYRLVPYIY